MLNELNPKALEIIKLMKFYSMNQGIKKIGSEYLLYAMYEQHDSLCRFLFSEYKISKDELLNEIQSLNIIRKSDKEYTNALENIFKEALLLTHNKEIGDEHLFMGILKTKCIARDILVNLGLVIEDLILDVKEIFDFDKVEDDLEFTINITKKALDNKLNVFVCRDEYINRMDVILRRKLKSNPLLIGNAGVGKTALVEGLAMHFIKEEKDYEIVSLNLQSMLAGTKYRGDFEQRVEKVVNEISKKENIILFIDEIHTIIGAGTTEGSLDVANMLKPVLARGDFKLIGATTLQEYHRLIEKDKALNRRFQKIFVKEPTIEETITILKGIKSSYQQHHKVCISDDMIHYLVSEATKRITKRYNPDKSIDILDEVMALVSSTKDKFITMKDIDDTIDQSIGMKQDLIFENLHFNRLSKYFTLNKMGLLFGHSLLRINYQGNDLGLDFLLKDLERGFGFTKEMILNLDLENYNEAHSISSLIGAPPGYVGYEDSGVLANHISLYPISIVIIRNLFKASIVVQNFIKECLKQGSFNDKQGNTISCSNTVFIICEELKINKPMGYLECSKKEEIKEDKLYDEYFTYNDNKYEVLNDAYLKSLNKYNIEASFMFDIIDDNKTYVDDLVLDLIKNKESGKVVFYQEENIVKTKKVLG